MNLIQTMVLFFQSLLILRIQALNRDLSLDGPILIDRERCEVFPVEKETMHLRGHCTAGRTPPSTCPEICVNFRNLAHNDYHVIAATEYCKSKLYDCFFGLPGRRGGIPIRYIHIPKSGGTSVEALFRSASFKLNITHQTDSFWSDDANACMVSGHLPYSIHRRELTILTFRNPVSFAISFHDYMRSINAANNHHIVKFISSPLNQLVSDRNSLLLSLLRDKQSAFLFWAFLNEHGACDENLSQTRDANTPSAYKFLEEMWYSPEPLGGSLSCAISLLKKIDLVAYTERLDDLIIQMRFRTGWLGWEYDSFSHVHGVDLPLKSSVSDEAKMLMQEEAKSGIDLPLYQEVVKLADEKTRYALSCMDPSSIPFPNEVLEAKSESELEEERSLFLAKEVNYLNSIKYIR
jgi:hypothetical protein